jgi:hypothetical protein
MKNGADSLKVCMETLDGCHVGGNVEMKVVEGRTSSSARIAILYRLKCGC